MSKEVKPTYLEFFVHFRCYSNLNYTRYYSHSPSEKLTSKLSSISRFLI